MTTLDDELKRAQIRKLELEAMELSHKAATAEIEHLNAADNRRHADANPSWARIYTFTGQVNDATVGHCMAHIATWARRDPGERITLMINSPGGSIPEGLALYDFLLELRAAGTPVDTVAFGYAASMAGVLLQAGERRIMGRSAHMLIHEASWGTGGKVGEMEDDIKFLKRLQDRLVAILAERSTLSPAQIRRRWTRTDWWLDADEALALGFVDEIRAAPATAQAA